MPRTEGRPSGRRWQKLWYQVQARRERCCRCANVIDYALRYPDPMSFSVDHYPHALITHPHLAWEPANLHAAHLVCNKQAGKARKPIDVGPTSEDW